MTPRHPQLVIDSKRTHFDDRCIPEERGSSRSSLLYGSDLPNTWSRSSESSIMLSQHAALLPSEQDAMASQDFSDLRTNHQFPGFGDVDLECLASVSSRNRIEIAFITDDTILATSPGGHHT